MTDTASQLCDLTSDSPNPGEFSCQRELVALFKTLVDVMFCIKSADGLYVEVNTAFVRRTGQSSMREVIGRTARGFFFADLAERYEEQDRLVVETGEPLRDELELVRRLDGSLGWYLTTKLPIFDPWSGRVTGIASVSRDLKTPTDNGVVLESLQKVVAHVRDNLDQVIRVHDLATVADCSLDQLHRRTRRIFGLTPKQYVLRARVDRATRLLTETATPLAEVATSVGFYDQSDFTRQFARHTNQTPATFRLEYQTLPSR